MPDNVDNIIKQVKVGNTDFDICAMYIDSTTEIPASQLTGLDTEISASSTNAVENRAIYEALQGSSKFKCITINFTADSGWTQDPTTHLYSRTFTATQTEQLSSSFIAQLQVTDGSTQKVLADQMIKNSDGSLTLSDIATPFTGQVLIMTGVSSAGDLDDIRLNGTSVISGRIANIVVSPNTGSTTGATDLTTLTIGNSVYKIPEQAEVAWGNITGDIATQTDLQTALGTKALATDLTAHTSDKSNPHAVTKSQVGLGNVQNKSMDSTPTADSTNYVTSGGVKAYVDNNGGKIDKIKINNVEQTISSTDKSVNFAVDGTYNSASNKIASQTTVSTAVTNAINALDVNSVGSNGSYLKTISETDGKISATAQAFDTVFTSASNNNAPTTKAVQDFVNSSIEASAARYMTYNASGDAFPTKAALEAATTFYYNGVATTPTLNDYLIVLADESKRDPETSQDPTTRYLYTGSIWSFQYIVNNKSFTAAQWAAINSGATSTKVTNYDTHVASTSNPHSVTKAQVGLGSVVNTGMDDAPTASSNNYVKSGGVATAITNAINALDVTVSGASASKTLATLTEADGKIAATFQDIAIAESQVTNLTTDLGNKVIKNADITAATKCKITYDKKGLVTAGADLAASDIPSLDASKITSGTFADARIASAATWNAKQDAIAAYLKSAAVADNTLTLTNKDDTTVAFTPKTGRSILLSEDDKIANITVTKDDTKGVSPYNASYGYTNIEVDITKVDLTEATLVNGNIITIMLKTAVASANRNTRIRFGSTGHWIPLYDTTAVIAGSSYLTASSPRHFIFSNAVYSTTEIPGAFHMMTDSNSTYSPQSLGFGYGTCATAEATTAKVVSLSSYSLVTHGAVSVKFTYAVPADATMNINSKGAKAIYYHGAAITAGIINAGDIAHFVYNGSQYILLGTDNLVTNAQRATWDAKQDALATQTAYTSQGSATKVPQITTNSLGQVTNITEVTITQPSAGSSATAVSTTASGGSATTWSKSDHVHNIALATGDSNGQVKIAGTNISVKGLGAHAYYADDATHRVVTDTEKTTWSGKQDALATQTAYMTKGSATKVPQITTNNLGQVTNITEVTITQPTVNNGTLTIQRNGTNIATFSANQSTAATANITVPTKVSELSNDSGFTTNKGTVTSVQVQAGTGLASSQSTAQTTTLNTTISIASGYKLPTTTEWNNKANINTGNTFTGGKQVINGAGSAVFDTPLDVRSNDTSTYIQFLDKNGTSLGYYGVKSDNKPYFYTNNDGDKQIFYDGGAYWANIPVSTTSSTTTHPKVAAMDIGDSTLEYDSTNKCITISFD